MEGGPPPILVFDFDNTLIEGDSDEWVARRFGAAEMFEELRKGQGKPWNEAMDAVLGWLHEERGVRVEQIEEALCSIPVRAETVAALVGAHGLGCQLHILSDANSFFISTILLHHRLLPLFSRIHSNPAWLDPLGRLHVGSFHTNPLLPRCPSSCPLLTKLPQCNTPVDPQELSQHSCLPFSPDQPQPIVCTCSTIRASLTKLDMLHSPHTYSLCPPNLCKGSVIDAIRADTHLVTQGKSTVPIIYAGDGSGDLCPSLRLTSHDYLLPRQDYPLSHLLSLGYLALVKAKVFPWDLSLASSLKKALHMLMESPDGRTL